MPTSEAHVAMETPCRYLGQLCKHFQHKLPVTLEESTGSIGFAAGPCLVEATDTHLLLKVSAGDDAGVAQLQDVVVRHLLRFAFRSPPEIIWSAPA